MTDSRTRDQRIAGELAKLRELNDAQLLSLDKSVGGPRVPRPSDEYINRSYGGPPKSEAELLREAVKKVDAQERQEAAHARAIDEERRAVERNSERLKSEGRDKPHSNRERLSGQTQDRPSTMRERIDQMAKGMGRRPALTRGDD